MIVSHNTARATNNQLSTGGLHGEILIPESTFILLVSLSGIVVFRVDVGIRDITDFHMAHYLHIADPE